MFRFDYYLYQIEGFNRTYLNFKCFQIDNDNKTYI